jgi:single-strand DNA-binding protein
MLNQVYLIGNIGNDPESRYTPSGASVLSFSVATNKKTKDGDKTTWWRVTVWNKLAETLGEILAKGQKVAVIGEFEEARIYTNKSGQQGASLEVTANTVRILSAKETGTGGGAAPTASDTDEDIPF